MSPEPALVGETRAWLTKAARDIATGEYEMTASPPFTGDAVLHAQQAVEKSLKAFLTWHGQVFRKTHNLVELGGECAEIDTSLEPLLRTAAPLTEYAWRYRYPLDPEEPSVDEAAEALAIARSVHEAVVKRLPSDVRP
jgi:HEPN domain-containing protein